MEQNKSPDTTHNPSRAELRAWVIANSPRMAHAQLVSACIVKYADYPFYVGDVAVTWQVGITEFEQNFGPYKPE